MARYGKGGSLEGGSREDGASQRQQRRSKGSSSLRTGVTLAETGFTLRESGGLCARSPQSSLQPHLPDSHPPSLGGVPINAGAPPPPLSILIRDRQHRAARPRAPWAPVERGNETTLGAATHHAHRNGGHRLQTSEYRPGLLHS